MKNAKIRLPDAREGGWKLRDRYAGLRHYLELVSDSSNLEPIPGTSKGFKIKQQVTEAVQ